MVFLVSFSGFLLLGALKREKIGIKNGLYVWLVRMFPFHQIQTHDFDHPFTVQQRLQFKWQSEYFNFMEIISARIHKHIHQTNKMSEIEEPWLKTWFYGIVYFSSIQNVQLPENCRKIAFSFHSLVCILFSTINHFPILGKIYILINLSLFHFVTHQDSMWIKWKFRLHIYNSLLVPFFLFFLHSGKND